MKNSIYLLVIIMALISINCSTEYVANKRYSKEDLYKNFNKNCSDRSIKITLTNDSSFVVPYGAKIFNDTIAFYNKGHNTIYGYIQLNNVKEASYKNHWLGMSLGLLAGIGVSAICVAAKVVPMTVQDGNPPYQDKYDYFTAIISEVPFGILIGSTAGWLIGWNYIYKFN
ncbi:MAG: hypothetical protein Q8903_09535 [Bacteroidota bacterium]|nr:hypothetical protein [Bacteroidota bacterium]